MIYTRLTERHILSVRLDVVFTCMCPQSPHPDQDTEYFQLPSGSCLSIRDVREEPLKSVEPVSDLL